MFKGKADNPASFRAPNFTIRLAQPKAARVHAILTYRLVANTDLCVDQNRQKGNEGFRLARIASSYLDEGKHDSDQVSYADRSGRLNCTRLSNENRLLFQLPQELQQGISLGHTDKLPRETPTLAIALREPRAAQTRGQGYITATANPNDDNVDMWINWTGAAQNYEKGAHIGTFSYELLATAPGEPICNNNTSSDPNL